MISTLVELLGNFYANNDFSHFETIARTIHAAVPDDPVSLQFLGLVFYRTGRVSEAISVFDQVQGQGVAFAGMPAKVSADKVDEAAGRPCAAVCYQEATKRNPFLAKVWYDLGAVLMQLKKSELAIPAFRSYIAAQPSPSHVALALSQVGLSLDRLGLDEQTTAGA